MRRASLIVSILSGCAVAASALAAQSSMEAGTALASSNMSSATSIRARALDNGVDTQAIHDATAAAVIGALQTRFHQRDVELKLDSIRSAPANRRDIGVTGTARIRIEGSRIWLPIRFHALYDPATLTVISPRVTLAERVDATASAASTKVPADSLDRAVDQRLAAEFATQQVDFQLDAMHVGNSGQRYAVIEGEGVVRFAGEGSAPVHIQAVYDRQADAWISVDYRFGNERFESAPQIAAR